MSITDSIVVCRDYAEMSRKAAEVFADYIKKNPHGILGPVSYTHLTLPTKAFV